MHAATFGGNPIAARAGIATIETIEQDGLARAGRRRSASCSASGSTPLVDELRASSATCACCGVMIGLELTIDGAPSCKACLDRRLLINCTHGTVIRLLPAMTLTDEQVDEGCDILAEVLRSNRSRVEAPSRSEAVRDNLASFAFLRP